jgi:uncharacterized protein DUF6632
MIRERTLTVLLVFLGLALLGCIYPLSGALLHPRTTDISLGDQMILGIYFPFGVFMLMAARNPSAHRSLIAAFGWSTLAHVGVMARQSLTAGTLGGDALPLGLLALVAVGLLALLPRAAAPASDVVRV